MVFSFQPDLGYEITEVLVDDVSVGSDPTYTFSNLSTNHTIVVDFILAPGTITDPLNDTSIPVDKSSNVTIYTSNPHQFEDDNARQGRNNTSVGYITYNFTNISTFSAEYWSYDAGGNGTVKIYGSDDGVSFTEINLSNPPPVDYGARTLTILSPTNTLNNTNYLKFEIDGGNGGWQSQFGSVAITFLGGNTNQDPVFTSSDTAIMDENLTDVMTVIATDDEAVTYSITAGLDQNLFSIDAVSGELSFDTAPDFEAPSDSNGDNQYVVEVTAEDGIDGSASQLITVSINDIGMPVVTVTTATNIDYTSADSGGDISSDGGASTSAQGICWNTTGNPTTSDSVTVDVLTGSSFSSSLSGLSEATTYYYRAYATNMEGTSYSNELSFTTLDNPIFNFIDFMDDYSLMYDYSSNIRFSSGNPSRFNGDTGRARRKDVNTGHITYNLMNTIDYTVNLYQKDNGTGFLKIYASTDGVSFNEIPYATEPIIIPGSNRILKVLTPASTLPANTNYLKIEFNGGSSKWHEQIGDVFISYIGAAPLYNPNNDATNSDNAANDNNEIIVNGLTENSFAEIGIYPNPVKNILYIENNKNIGIKEIIVYDISGKIVLSKKDNFQQLDLSEINSGLLFIKIVTIHGILTKKLIKE